MDANRPARRHVVFWLNGLEGFPAIRFNSSAFKCFIFHADKITQPARFPKRKDCVLAQVFDNQRNPVALFRLFVWLVWRSFGGAHRACRFSGWPLPALWILSTRPAGRTPTRILALPHSWPHSNLSSWVCQWKTRPARPVHPQIRLRRIHLPRDRFHLIRRSVMMDMDSRLLAGAAKGEIQ